MTSEEQKAKSLGRDSGNRQQSIKTVAVDARMIRSSGIGTYLEAILSRIVPAHPEVRFIIHGDPAEMGESTWSRLPQVRLNPWLVPVYSPRGMWTFPKTTERVDAVWFPHYVSPFRVGAPSLMTIHDIFPLANPEMMGGKSRVIAARFLFSHARRRARSLIFVSKFTAAEFNRLVGSPKCTATVIPNAVENSWFTPVMGKSPHQNPYVVAVGNVKPHKNIGRLLMAMSLLPPSCAGIDLVIVGQRDGFLNGDATLSGLIDGLSKRVHFTGRVTSDELRRFVAFSKALVYPSLYEGFGLPPLEAMAMGTPVIASRIPAILEACDDAVQYIDPRDPSSIALGLASVLVDKDRQKTLIERGRAQVKLYSWDATASATWQLLMDVAN